jgi:hypothetical protein
LVIIPSSCKEISQTGQPSRRHPYTSIIAKTAKLSYAK